MVGVAEPLLRKCTCGGDLVDPSWVFHPDSPQAMAIDNIISKIKAFQSPMACEECHAVRLIPVEQPGKTA